MAAGTVESVADESDDPKHAVIELIIAASSMSMPMPEPEPEPQPEEQQDEGGVSPAVFRTRHRDHPVLRDMKTEAGSEAVLFDRGAVVRPTQIDLLSCRRGAGNGEEVALLAGRLGPSSTRSAATPDRAGL